MASLFPPTCAVMNKQAETSPMRVTQESLQSTGQNEIGRERERVAARDSSAPFHAFINDLYLLSCFMEKENLKRFRK